MPHCLSIPTPTPSPPNINGFNLFADKTNSLRADQGKPLQRRARRRATINVVDFSDNVSEHG
jgi:hypothetical protein